MLERCAAFDGVNPKFRGPQKKEKKENQEIVGVSELVGTQVVSTRGCISCMIQTFHIILHNCMKCD